MSLGKVRRTAEEVRGRLASSKSEVERERKELREAKRQLKAALKARKIIQSVSAVVQASAHKRISDLVSRCLSAVFGENAYRFEVKFHKRRGKTEAELTLSRDGSEVDPTDGAGGGVADVAAFALRLACLMLQKPKRRKLLVLDEPFRHLSADYRPAARVLLEALASELDVQMLIVTHDREFRIGKVIEID